MSETVKVCLFWVFLALLFVTAYIPDNASPFIPRGRWVFAVICLVILGLKVFGGN